MKKVLFATTALIATASVAAADIRLNGQARFGIGYLEDRSDDPNVDDTILISRYRLNLDAGTETDGGVEFSTRLRLQQEEDAATGEAGDATLSGARFSVIYGGLRVDAGNVSGAIDNLANRAGYEPGLEFFIGQAAAIDYDFLAFSSSGNGANAVFFQYAVGDFAFGASYDTDATDGEDQWDISLTYAFNNITAAIAYGEDDDQGSLTILTLGADFGNWRAAALVADDDINSDIGDGTAWGLSVEYDVNAATSIQVAYGDGSSDDDTQQYGIGARYDLGGGAALRGGIGNIKEGDADSQLRADFGAVFDF